MCWHSHKQVNYSLVINIFNQCVAIYIYAFTELGYAQSFISPVESSLFQCQLSSDQSGQVFTPNIPDVYFNLAAFRNDLRVDFTFKLLRRGTTYILTIPPESVQRNCSGSAMAIQYCYQVRDISQIATFEFLSLTRDRLQFTMKRTLLRRSIPTNHICSSINITNSGISLYICCDISRIEDTTSLQIPSSSYTFGVTVRDVRLVAFAKSTTEYRFEQFQTMLDSTFPTPSDTSFTLNKTDRLSAQSLPLLRFFIGMHVTVDPHISEPRLPQIIWTPCN